MSYQPGKMGVAAGTAIVFTTTFTSFFLSVWSVFTDQAATAAWLVPSINAVCFLSLFWIVLYVMQRVPGDLYEVAERLLGKTGARLITLYFITTFFIDAVLTLRQFAENTLLTAIPSLDISLVAGWYVLIASFYVYLGIEPIARAAYIVLPVGLTALTLLLLGLYTKFHLYNLRPWLGDGLGVLLKSGVPSSGFYLHTFILAILAPAFQNLRTIRTAALLGIGLTTIFRTLTLIMYMGIFSVEVGREKVLPFYEMARLIYLSRYLQRVEAFYIILWVILGLATIAIDLYMANYLLTRLFNLQSMRPLILPLAIIAAQLALIPADIATAIELNVKADTIYFAAGVLVVPVVLLMANLIKGKRKAKSCATN